MPDHPITAPAHQYPPAPRPCCVPHGQILPCQTCATEGRPALPDAATRERRAAQRYCWLRHHATRSTFCWTVRVPVSGDTFDVAVDAAMREEPR